MKMIWNFVFLIEEHGYLKSLGTKIFRFYKEEFKSGNKKDLTLNNKIAMMNTNMTINLILQN